MRCPKRVYSHIKDVFKSYHTQINPHTSQKGNTVAFFKIELETISQAMRDLNHLIYMFSSNLIFFFLSNHEVS